MKTVGLLLILVVGACEASPAPSPPLRELEPIMLPTPAAPDAAEEIRIHVEAQRLADELTERAIGSEP